MGHKAVAVFDLDVLDLIDKDPVEFARRLKSSILTHRRLGGSVSVGGATVANVVWSGHADLSPVLKFVDFHTENVTYREALDLVAKHRRDESEKSDVELLADCQSLIKTGQSVEALRKYRGRFNCDLKSAMKALGLSNSPIV